MAIKLHDDGTITATIQQKDHKNKDYALRTPSMDELFDLWKAAQATAKAGIEPELAEVVAIETKTKKTKTDVDDDTEKTQDQIIAEAEASADRSRRILASNAQWAKQAFAMLADPPFAEDDLVPSWFGSGILAGKLITHWQNVPLDRGE